jgi:N-acetyl-alpha-D-muramate 1-phosphate uridylyltransferase
MKAMILAAGKGTRLGKLTESIPKALVDINGKSALRVAVEKCTSEGFSEIIINVHHFAEQVENEVCNLNKSGYDVSVSDEREQLLETGGGLYMARSFFTKEPFLVYNVDIISDIDLQELFRFHIANGGVATLAAGKRKGGRVFLVDHESRVKGWRNNSTGEEILTCEPVEPLVETSFLGIHIINPEIFNYMSDGVYSLTDLYLRLAASHNIYTFDAGNIFWADIGSPESLESVRARHSK